MKTFKELRQKAKPVGKPEFRSKVGKVEMRIVKEKGKFVVYIDNEVLDDYSSMPQAKKMGLEFAKEVGK